MKTRLQVSVLIGAMIAFGWTLRVSAEDGGPKPDDLFKKLDVNGDGKLTADEIPAEHKKSFERLVRIGDSNKDGILTREEFDQALSHKEAPVTDISKVGNLGIGAGGQRPNFDPKRIFEMLDKNKDGKLTREEVENRPRIKALFDQLGKNELTLDDLQGMAGRAGKAKGKKGKAAKAAQVATAEKAESEMKSPGNRSADSSALTTSAFFKLLDTNHDGQLSKEELSAAGKLFEQLDRNKDGVLDAKELVGAKQDVEESEPAEVGKPPAGKVTGAAKGQGRHNLMALFKRADKNGDGKISMEEAPPVLKKRFAKIDTNGDGFLDKSEVEAAMEKMQRRKNVAMTPDGENSDEAGSAKQKSGL